MSNVFLVTILLILGILFLGPHIFLVWLYVTNRKQTQHSLLRGTYWFLGILRYMIEHVGPEFRFYITDDDNDGKPISRNKFTAIVKASKYTKVLISFGSKRDFNVAGLYLKNSLFPLLEQELRIDNSFTIETQRYATIEETLFFRHENKETVKIHPWLLLEDDAVILGNEREHPWPLRGLLGMSGMSYGALGKNAIAALSKGIALAGASWMNTGEGGLSDYHLLGGCDLIYQIGPGLFGVRNNNGELDWDLVRQKAKIPQIKAFELKLAQGAKIRGGHVEGTKVNPEIARIRGVTPWQNIDSPCRFPFMQTEKDLIDFVCRLQDETGLPVGIKIVVGNTDSMDKLCEEFVKRDRVPDFITVDGGEGGTGATYQELADTLGLPVYTALIIVDNALRKAGIRDRVKIIASGKLHLPDEIAIALGLGADLVNIARGFMIAIGCIMAQKCHSNECPVGVATTAPRRERALFVDEKKYRVLNYIITLRAGLFHMAGACGLSTPRLFERKHVVLKDNNLSASNCETLFPYSD